MSAVVDGALLKVSLPFNMLCPVGKHGAQTSDIKRAPYQNIA